MSTDTMSTDKKAEIDAMIEGILVESFSKMFIVNVNTGEYTVYLDDGMLEDGLEDVPDIYTYMQRLITDGIICSEYATACRRFTNPEYVRKSVFPGHKRIVQSYRCHTPKGDKWVTFGIIAGFACSPENPTVLYTWREAESDAITLLDTLPTISSLYDKLIRINLTNNTYEPVIVDVDEQEQLVGGVINMYEWWADYSKEGNIAAEDIGVFKTLTKEGSLQKRFAADKSPVSFRYRKKVGDEFRWMQLEITPSVEYSEENQIMLLSLKDVHEEYTAQMRSRQELIDNMNRDALTSLFNRLKFNADVEKLRESDGQLFTCLYIDVNGLHELNNTLGHQKGDEMLCCIADTLCRYFPNESVYRIGGDEFVVLSTNLSEQTVKHAVDGMRGTLRKENYEISVGIATGTRGADIETIVAAAETEMRNDKAAYYMHNGDRRKKRQMNEKLEQMLVEKRDKERFLQIITDQFSGVYFVVLASDAARYVYDPNLFSEFLKESDGVFSAAMRLYIKRLVKPAYHACFDDVLDYDKLEQTLDRDEVAELTYQKVDGSTMIARILRVEKEQNANSETIWMIWRRPN